MKKTLIFLLIALTILAVSCTAGPNEFSQLPDKSGEIAGFWMGLWHGFIALFTFVISLFNDSVQVYEVHNKGNLYNLGFILGVMMFFGNGGHQTSKHSRRC
ncbi:MAG: hypothetical protein H8D46_00655 [FCB group bacterium]|nr:hypothetical protein [FCB group bacterium]